MKLFEKFRDDVIAQLKDGYDLTFVDQGDKLMDNQIDALVAGDWEMLYSSNMEWESDNRRHGAEYEMDDEVAWVVADWREHDRVATYVQAGVIDDVEGEVDCEGNWTPESFDYDDLADDFKSTNEYDDVRMEIESRDSSNVYRQLAGQSGTVLMRHVLGDTIADRQTVTDVIEWLKFGAEEGTVLKRNARNMKVIREVLTEACLDDADAREGMIVYAASVGDLYDLGECEYVEIVNPYLWIGSAMSGNGQCDGPLDAVIRVKHADLRTDKGAYGYGWNEVAGVVTSYYECEIRKVETKENAA